MDSDSDSDMEIINVKTPMPWFYLFTKKQLRLLKKTIAEEGTDIVQRDLQNLEDRGRLKEE